MEDTNKKFAGVSPTTVNIDLAQPHALVTDGFGDLPPSYEASTAIGSNTSGHSPSRRREHRSPRSSTSTTRSHDGLLGGVSQPPAPEPQPTAEVPSQEATGENTEGYKHNDPMYWSGRSWEELNGTPGCCASSSGGCCFSSRGGCCFSDRGGCCFSDREGCFFSDRGGCCCSDLSAAFCSDGR